MANLTLRGVKGTDLSQIELDANFTALNDGLPVFHASEYGVVPGAADNTAEIQAVIDAAYAATAGTLGGATVVFPPGRFNVTSVSRVFANARTIKIQGAGRLATVFQKIGATTTPMFDFSSGVASTPQQGVDFADFTIIGNAKANPGIRLTLMANFTFHRVSFFQCSTAVDLIGSLLGSLSDCVINNNTTGMMTRKYVDIALAGGGIFCNLIRIISCTINSNTSWALDIGDADGTLVQGTNLEGNGTLATPGTGAVIVRSTVVDENPRASFTVNGSWFEANRNRAIEVEAAAGLNVYLSNCHAFSLTDEGGGVINIGVIRSLYVVQWTLQLFGAELISAATRTIIIGERPFNFTDNSNTTIINENISTLAMRLEDGITAPATAAGYAQLYVDTVDGALKVKYGDGVTNVIDVGAAGWKDMLAPLSAAGVPGANAPTITNFVVGTIQRREYAFALDDYLYLQPFHVNHDIKPGGLAYLHVHWTTNGTSTNTVRWELQVARALGHNQASFTQSTTLYVEQAASGTAYRHMVTEVALADALTLTEPDELILVTVKRVTNGGTNNTDTVFGLMCDLHYESDRDATPQKAPDFYAL